MCCNYSTIFIWSRTVYSTIFIFYLHGAVVSVTLKQSPEIHKLELVGIDLETPIKIQ